MRDSVTAIRNCHLLICLHRLTGEPLEIAAIQVLEFLGFRMISLIFYIFVRGVEGSSGVSWGPREALILNDFQ